MGTIFGVEIPIGTLINYVVAIVTIATFLLAIAKFFLERKKGKEDITVEVMEGRASKLLIGVPKEEFPKHRDASTIIITAVNKGHRVVMLREIELWVENIEKLNLRNILPEFYAYNEGKPVYHTLPFDSNPGKDFPCRIYSEDISRALTRKGYTGEQKLWTAPLIVDKQLSNDI